MGGKRRNGDDRPDGGHDDGRATADSGGFGRRSFLKGAAASAGVVAGSWTVLGDAADAAPNPISVENARTGVPPDEWDSYEDDTIEGFATDISVNAGQPIRFKVKTDSNNYRIRIYRMGWYQGLGARRIAEILPSVPLPQTQPAPLTDASTGLIDCGNWAVSATWNVPSSAVSGVYFANFERLDPGNVGVSNRAMFVVRNDGRQSDVLLQTSDTTMAAYNRWGGYSFYYGEPLGRAYKLSYNRPMRMDGPNSFFDFEYPLIRWLERNGYDVAYTTDVDSDRRGAEILNHKLFVSSGHDEYWSAAQRANVEAALAAGVNLAFITGNEVFWKVRWEPSTDPSHTAYRTLVCYKETLAGAKIDPSPEWTGTWRDPRFSPPSDGGRPETPLIGQIFGAINDPDIDDPPIKVPAEYGRLRFWRNTDVAALPAGQTATLTQGTLGYEWDDDRETGGKPAGLVELTSTTATALWVLVDNGGQYETKPATHRLTLYRAPSGGLVFATGTCQWSWGLDDFHPRTGGLPQARVQQATANLLADMSILPATLQSGLVAPVPTTDTLPPATTITSPLPGADVPVGNPVTVTGTATDSGGQVAVVEVSIDGGTTWKRAAGANSWSFVFIPTALGPLTIRARAVDDSVNIESVGASRSVDVVQRPFPASIWHESVTPATPATSDANPIEVGVKFRSVEEGFITGVRFYKGPGNTGTHVGRLWTASGIQLAQATFSAETPTGWQQALFATPVSISANTTYVVSYFAPNGHYAADPNYFSGAYDVWPLRALADGEDGANGVFRYGSSGFPTSSFSATNYWVDAVFDIDDGRAPTVIDRNPAPNLDSVALNATPKAKFSETMTGSSIVMELERPDGTNVSGSTAYDSATRTATFTPSSALAPLTTYTARVVAARDKSGQDMASPDEWSFTTTGSAGQYPLTLWDTSAVPAVPSITDNLGVELGVRFRADEAGLIKGIRFYKGPANTGGHVAHLWTLAGTLLATATYDNESETGWQQANFSTPVSVAAGQTYVASYYAPAGGYSANASMFSSSVDRGILHVPAGGDIGGNGVFRYGVSGFPSSSYQNTNYWVDVVFVMPPDVTGPSVTDRSPAPNLLSVATSTTVRATFNEAINPSTLSFTLSGPGGNVAASVAYDSASRTATLTPSAALAQGTQYTASVQASDTAGNAMPAPVTWSFTTVQPAGTTPATVWDTSATPAVPAANDGSAIELGLKFRADSDGQVTGIRFYKGTGNTGAHAGHLWDSAGTLLGTANFSSETAGGWQQANFASPIAVAAGQTYVASYHAPAGHYSVSAGFFSSGGADRPPLHALQSGVDGSNGVYRYGPSGFPTSSFNSANYWVDVVFVDATGPSVVTRTPAAGATGVAHDIHPSATFSESIVTTNLTFTLRNDTAGQNVAGTWAYDSGSRTVTFTPNAALVPASAYTATVAGARDVFGNPMSAPHSWSFTTMSAGLLTIWPATATPGVPAANDNSAIEIGVKFRSDTAGSITGIRFYKGSGNTGTHVGNVWRSDGALLGSVTFSGETGTGWQQANFSTPIPITAGTTYVASYYAPVGRYSVNGGYFSSSGVDNGVLHALANGVDGGNGVYRYGSGGGFPVNSWNASNYWIDVVFQEGT